MFNRLLITGALVAACWTPSYTQTNPIPNPKDARIKMVSFQEDNVVPVYGKTFTATQIVFGQDEYVKGIEGGDTSGWIVDYKPIMPNMIFIKPTILDSNSNITVITNKHHYYFKVKSNKTLNAPDESATYAIKFSYPIDARNQLKAQLKKEAAKKASLTSHAPPKVYNRNYSFSGNKQIMPLHVFDDGTFTYFELQKNKAVPAIFAVDDAKGKEAIVNTRREGAYLVVQRLAPQFTLRNGGTVASVFNTNEIIRIKQGRG
ncbi:MAG: P-type conjugative transfer protein VirB9 [Legionella sp.]|nr:P-type conjugative transfer protein VirB9 [Legionella sp.]